MTATSFFRISFLPLMAMILLIQCQPTKPTTEKQVTFILVRHAEKASSDADTPLSEAGEQRAQRLAEILRDLPLKAIYSTPFRRTRDTAQPTADAHGLEIRSYTHSNPDSMARALLDRYDDGAVLISGHSNSTPELANYLLGEEKYPFIKDADYTHLLLITCREDRKCHSLLLHY